MKKQTSKFRRTTLTRSILAASWASAALLAAQPALAQGADKDKAQLERVEITGSSIKRIAAEGALPVTVMKAEEIRASGVTSVADLVKKLTATQGATGESASVGGEAYGFSGINIHNIGENRTLVLLNGRRLASFGGQTLTGFAAGFDLNAIPISAIERVELLTDGASALYGSDAIGGVVNFITKRDSTEGDVTIGTSRPKSGAVEKRFSATKGFGSLDKDNYNVMLSFSKDERTQLNSVDRPFAATGKALFSRGGQQYRIQQFSARPIPANVIDDLGQLISPFQKVNGACPPNTFRVIEPYNDGSGLVDDYCGFDFVSQLEIYPERKRDSFMASFTAKLGAHELFADVLLGRTSQVSRIAAVPGAISILAGSPLHNTYLLPLGITQDTLALYRLSDLGKRTSNDTADFRNIVVGSRGEMYGWDYNTSYTHSVSDVKGSISGYPGALAVRALTSSGLLDPFVGPGLQSAAGLAAILAAKYVGPWNGGTSTLDTLNLNGSRQVSQMPGGPVMLGSGINFNREKIATRPSLFAQGLLSNPVTGTLCDGTPGNECDQRFGDEAATPPFSASRTSKGVFGELSIPLTKALEFGAAARFDSYSDFGSAKTGKASFRWAPASNMLFRGSIGNGFHAPSVPQVSGPLQPYGVTNGDYTCTPALLAVAVANGANCQPGSLQYDQFAGGNPALRPEKSKQATLGFRIEPTSSTSFGVDLWHVQMKDAFGQLSEDVVFANPGAFPDSWTTKVDTGTGVRYLAFKADNKNLGKSFATGLDFDISGRMKTDFGLLTSQLALTYMLRETSQLVKGGSYFSAIGNFADLGTVTFRTQGRWTTSLKTGNWTNTLGVSFKSGYRDQETTVEVLDALGNVTGTEDMRLKVKAYATLDWQTAWAPTKDWVFNVGVLNLLNTAPPFSISGGGNNRGQQFGYDDRYYDPRGRTVYLNASLKF